MKGKSFFLKTSLNIIIVFSFLSSIISFEKLPNWNTSTIKVLSLSQDLSNSQIIDYAINNYTNTKIYSIYEGDNYYFYLIDDQMTSGKKYPHYFYDFKYFTSPLIEYNKEYYFCSSLKNMTKITSNGEIVEIPNPDLLDDYINYNYELKCYFLPNMNRIIVVFLNTPYVYYYNFTDYIKQLEIDSDSNIIDANAYNVEKGYESSNENNFYLEVLYGNESSNHLNAYRHYGENLGYNFGKDFGANIYSKRIISFSIWNSDPIGLVFTYEPKEMNKYNIFYVNMKSSSDSVYNGCDYFTMFKDSEIYDAFFVENCPILIYIIRKRERDSTFNFYLGAVDIESFVILYNIKINKEKKLYFDNGYFYQNKGFLRFFEDGKEVEICPFYYDSSDSSCKFIPNNSQYFYIVESSGINTNIIRDYCPYGEILNKYCFKNCPMGLGKKDGKCILCPSDYGNKFYKFSKKECLSYVDNIYPNKGDIYYDCENNYFEYNCYDDCSEIYGVNKDNLNECVTCESKGQIFDGNKCVDSCDIEGIGLVHFELNGINYTFCKNCSEIGKFYYEKICYDECPSKSQVYDENNICFFCKERFKDKKYKFNGTCVSECIEGFETVEGENEIYCKNCSEEGLVYDHNKKCNSICEEHSLYYPVTNICYFCYELEENLFYQNNACVSECDSKSGFAPKINGSDRYCQFCHDDDLYYFNNECIGNCPEKHGWNDTNNICIDCHASKLYFKNHSCVPSCGTYILSNDNITCKPCPLEYTYFFEYECVQKCPENTVLTEDKYCKICNGKLQNNVCVDECSKGYVVNKTLIENTKIEVEKCVTCDELNSSYWFNGNECVDNCPITKYRSKDNICRLCFCGFSNYNCDKESDKCKCDDGPKIQGEIFGDNCEFFTKTKRSVKTLSIVPIGSVISSKKSYFTFNLTNENYKNSNYIFSIKWSLFIDSIEVTDLQKFPAGIYERIFIINSDVLQPGEIFNEIKIEVNITDENNENNNIKYTDSIKVYIQSLNQNRDIILDSPEGINKVMENTFSLDADNLAGIDDYKFYYRFLIEDEHNEIIPIKQRKELDPLIDRQSKKLSFMLPIFKSFLFELSNIREEKYIATYVNKKNENSNMEYNLEDIFNKDKFSDNYDEIEKIFLIMKYLDINKDFSLNITDNEYNDLFGFIKNKSNNIANANGKYESPELNKEKFLDEKTTRYYINYYEPKTIFSLMNKLFLNQEEKLPENLFNETINIFWDFFDILIKLNNSEKLDNSNILSFFRTFDHFVTIYINKEKKDNKKIFNITAVFEILNKLSEYLISEIYPGETIRLVGKKISLFLSRFGEYQNNLSFGTINNITKYLKYDNYNTFSFDDYNINQDKCDDEGNSLLCIQDKNYMKLKENVPDLHNYSISLLAINNNNDDIYQNENEGNTFKLKIMNYDGKKLVNDTSFFYDIEFPFYYIPHSSKKSNNKEKVFIENNGNNNDKINYENITCIPKNHLYNKYYYCLTFFNYEKNIIKCSCNIMDEITYVSDYKIAKFYKEIQIKGKFKTYGLFNKNSLYGLFGLLAFILLPNFIYLLYEIINDIKKSKYKLLSYTEKVKDNYLKVKSLNNTSLCSFSILTYIYKFPYLSPLRNCNLQVPKYVKHFINTLAISYGVSTPLLLFFFYMPFAEKQSIIDKRDVKNPDFKVIDKHIIFKYLNRCIIFSLFGVIISGLFIWIMGKILVFNKDEKNYWRTMKNIFSNYIENKIKREVLFGSSWNKIKLRMIAYYYICGNYILNKNMKKKRKINEHFINYLTTSQAKERDSENMLLPLDCNEEMLELRDNKSKSGKYRAPSINNKKGTIKNNHFSLGAINDSKDESINTNKNIKVVNMDNFQLYGSKIKVNKLIEKNNKFERIKNKYICKKSNKDSLEDEIESGSRSCSFEYNNYYKDLEIQYENNITFLSIGEYIISEAIIKKQTKKGKTSTVSISSNQNPEGYWPIIISSFVLSILLLTFVIIMFKCIKLILDDFGSFIINIWISSSIFIYLFAYPVLYYIKIFIGSFLLFKCYHLKNRLIGKFFYWIFVDKTMIYIFKVRNYITKYKKEIDY